MSLYFLLSHSIRICDALCVGLSSRPSPRPDQQRLRDSARRLQVHHSDEETSGGSGSFLLKIIYRVFHRFGQAKFGYDGLVLGLSHFPLFPRLPQYTTLASKMVKSDSKILLR